MEHRPGRSVRASQDGVEYEAWVPDPLPPDLEYDAAFVTALSDAAAALGELAGAGRNLPNPHLLLNPFLRKEAVLSSRIEGTQATIADVYAYEAAQLPLPGMSDSAHDVREVVNYVTALNAGLARIHDYPISLGFIADLHRDLMTDVRGKEMTPGEFRTRQNLIGAPGATLETARYVPPPVILMKDALRAFEDYIRLEDAPQPKLVRLALIHYQFEAIHPFNDGNGRVGRLLISLFLVRWRLLSLPLLYLSAYFERNRGEYYDSLEGVTERGDWRAWILFFLQGVHEQAEDATKRAKKLQDLRESLRERFAVVRGSATTARLISGLFEQPVITIATAAEIMNASYHLARRQVHRLVDAGILISVGTRGHQEFFVAPAILEAVED